HLARAQSRVSEFIDKALDVGGAAIERGSRYDGARQGKTLNSLSRPFGTDLGTRKAPDLFGVGLEENFEESATQAVRDPLFEMLFRQSRMKLRVGVTPDDAQRIPDAEPSKGVPCLERVVEVLPVVMDPRQARNRNELRPEQLVPQRLNRPDLCEEP